MTTKISFVAVVLTAISIAMATQIIFPTVVQLLSTFVHAIQVRTDLSPTHSRRSVAENKTLRNVTERNFLFQTISNATFSVDTFFFIRYVTHIAANGPLHKKREREATFSLTA